METGNKLLLNKAIKHYKNPNGSANFPALLSIPFTDRLPSLINKEGEERIHKLIGAAVHLAMESLNLLQPLTANQTIDLVDEIIDSSTEDYLSLEDIVLFLQKLVRGQAGELYKHMDIASFMSKFEEYRQQRHSEYLKAKEEIHIQRKVIGNEIRKNPLSKDEMEPSTFFDLWNTLYDTKKTKE